MNSISADLTILIEYTKLQTTSQYKAIFYTRGINKFDKIKTF